jgi:hypothetical protein
LLVKFSTLQEYGVDKPFFLENDNVDASQRNVVFLVRGEKAKTVMRVAGTITLFTIITSKELCFAMYSLLSGDSM